MVGFCHWVYIPHTFGTSSLGSGILPLTKGYSFLPFSAHSSGNITTTGMTLGRLGTSIVGNVVRPSRKSNMAISPKRCKSWRRQELSRATQLSRLRSQGDAWPQTEGEASTGVKRKQPGLTLWMYYDVLMIYIYIYIFFFFGGWFGTWLLWLSISREWKIIPTVTHSIIFQRGRYTTIQIYTKYTYIIIMNIHML